MPPPKGRLPPLTKTAPPLPPLPKLRVRHPNRGDANPCAGIMSSMLGCWASNGAGHEGCAALEMQLRGCMDQKRSNQRKKNNINFHLGRMYPLIRGPSKAKGKKRK